MEIDIRRWASEAKDSNYLLIVWDLINNSYYPVFVAENLEEYIKNYSSEFNLVIDIITLEDRI